jgi:hypothetical protein
MSCGYDRYDGAYVLGALNPSERRAFEEHLAECPSCSRAVREIAGLPGLLSRVGPDVLEEDPDEPPLPPTLLPTLLDRVRHDRRRRTAVLAGLAAAAAVVATVGTAVVLGVTGGDGGHPSQNPPVAGPTLPGSLAGSRPMTPVGAEGSMRASVALADVAWGTRLDLTCSYASEEAYPHQFGGRPTAYSLVVRTRDGQAEQVATWRALPGRTMQLTAATDARQGQITSVEVRTAQGEPVLRLDT